MDAFVGSWTLDKNDNLDAFLKAVGMGAIKRGLAGKLPGSMTITALAGGKYQVVVSNGPKTKEVDITFGVEYEDEGAEAGVKAKGVWTCEDGKMIGRFVTTKGNKLTVTRQIVNGNMEQAMDWDGIVGKRIYKKK